MNRRAFITLIGGAAAWPFAARAQQQAPVRVLRVGTASPNARTFPFWVAFDQWLRELGYIEGQNLDFEFIHTGDRVDRISEAIQELVRRKVDVIVESSGHELGLEAALAATATLPIVMIALQYDPIELGHVNSLARPTGNVTGIYSRRPELVVKQLEILAHMTPGRTRLGVLWDMNSPGMIKAAERAAASLNLEFLPLELKNPPYDFVVAFRTLAEQGSQILLVISSTYFNRDRPHITGLTMLHRLPTMFSSKLYVDAVSCPTDRASPTCTDVRPTMSTGSREAPSPPICRWSSRQSTNWPSTSRPRGHSALRCRRCCSPPLMR